MKLIMAVLMSFMAFVCTSCKDGGPDKPQKPDPAKIEKWCDQAGQDAALAWIAADKPTKEQVAKMKVICQLITENCKAYQEGGFKASLPGIDLAIAKAFPGDTVQDKALRKLGHNLASNMLDGLDGLFEKHPEWKKDGAAVAGYVAVFSGNDKQGAISQLNVFMAQ